ncbi:thioredoxin family protein [Flavisolibacter nicotianae]|uniref:thioredoxin family protein n=1 Tax=Flavisolibacter nicotianae TaxID=2364882 RepID=UPI000EB3D148|nr:thioredoxin family protein [Flavisolibacter nicotianae]
MKILALLLLLTSMLPVFSQENKPAATDVLKPALAKASVEQKNVLLIFHASWCGWCRKMDSSLADRTIKEAIDRNYVIAHLTVYESPGKKYLENPGALEFLTQHGASGQGIPYWFVLDKNGTVLFDSQYKPGKNSGCPASEEEVAYFMNVLKKTATLREEEVEAIRKRFRQNE